MGFEDRILFPEEIEFGFLNITAHGCVLSFNPVLNARGQPISSPFGSRINRGTAQHET